MKYLLFTIALLFIGLSSSAQISYVEDEKVSGLFSRFVWQNKATEATLGWRVQLMASTDRRKLETEKSKFLHNFPHLQPIVNFDAPHYKLRVGAFKTKIEAEALRQEVKSSFPSAFPAKDIKIRPIEYL
ncbi:MAG: SPOR domain-containing protein [Saprospiraceae bacterium]